MKRSNNLAWWIEPQWAEWVLSVCIITRILYQELEYEIFQLIGLKRFVPISIESRIWNGEKIGVIQRNDRKNPTAPFRCPWVGSVVGSRGTFSRHHSIRERNKNSPPIPTAIPVSVCPITALAPVATGMQSSRHLLPVQGFSGSDEGWIGEKIGKMRQFIWNHANRHVFMAFDSLRQQSIFFSLFPNGWNSGPGRVHSYLKCIARKYISKTELFMLAECFNLGIVLAWDPALTTFFLMDVPGKASQQGWSRSF